MRRWAPPAVFSKKGVIHSVDLRDEERLWPPRDLPHSVGTRQAAAVPAPFGVLIQALSLGPRVSFPYLRRGELIDDGNCR
jgi:hypothetical protein